VPTGQIGDTTILSAADDVIASKVLPVLMSQNQNYLKYTDTISVTTSSYKYRFPIGAVGGGAVEILRKETSDDGAYYNMPLYTDADKGRVRGMHREHGFILTAGGFEVWPKPTCSFNVEITYLLRPGKLTASSNTAKVVAVDTVANTVELGATPSSLLGSTTWDVMKSDGLCERTAVGLIRGAQTGAVFIVTGDLTNVAVGDTVAVGGYAPFVHLPDEYIDFILDQITAKMAQHTGDIQLLKTSNESAQDSLPKISNVTSPRVSEEVPGIRIDW
jgi:hypothetical protein